MVCPDNFLFLSLLLVSLLDTVGGHEVTNLRQLTKGLIGKIFPRFSPNESIVSFFDFAGGRERAFELDVAETDSRLRPMSARVSSLIVGYVNETHRLQAVATSFPTPGEGSKPSMESLLSYEPVLVDRNGQITRRYSNLRASFHAFIFGYKNGKVLGVGSREKNSFNLILSDIESGDQKVVHYGSENVIIYGAFHPSKNIVFYSDHTADKGYEPTIFSQDVDTGEKKIIYKTAENESLYFYSVCNEGRYLLVCRNENWRRTPLSCIAGTISVETGEFEAILLDGEPFEGHFFAVSKTGKYLVFVHDGGSEGGNDMYVVDWRKGDDAAEREPDTDADGFKFSFFIPLAFLLGSILTCLVLKAIHVYVQ